MGNNWQDIHNSLKQSKISLEKSSQFWLFLLPFTLPKAISSLHLYCISKSRIPSQKSFPSLKEILNFKENILPPD